MALRNKDLISIHDLSVGEVATILDVSRKLKKKQKLGEPHEYLKGKTLAMIFSKASTRTRVSFETGFHQLGGHPIYMSEATSQIGRGEPVKDTARVLSRFVDGIMIRTFSHDAVKELADYATVPVINGLTDLLHPCQALTDMFTILEYIRHQAALGFLSEEFAQDEKNLVAIPVNQIATGHVNFVWNRDPNQFPALKRFLAFVEERYGKKELLHA